MTNYDDKWHRDDLLGLNEPVTTDQDRAHAARFAEMRDWFEDRHNLAAVARDMLLRGYRSERIVEMLERPWRFKAEWERVSDDTH